MLPTLYINTKVLGNNFLVMCKERFTMLGFTTGLQFFVSDFFFKPFVSLRKGTISFPKSESERQLQNNDMFTLQGQNENR